MAASRLSVELMRWLHTQEFNRFERCCSGILGWPNWHWPVLTMYGGHLALNHVAAHVAMPTRQNGQMDAGADRRDPVTDLRLKHAHCWHSDEFFSKIMFSAGKYDGMDLAEKTNMAVVRDYVAVIALSADRLVDDEMAKVVNGDIAFVKDDQNWKRLKPV